VRFRTHLLTSAAAGLALYPRSPLRIALVVLGGVAIDMDHFVLYAVRSGDWSVDGALRYDRRRHGRIRRGDTRPRYGTLRSEAHRPLLTLPLVWVLALACPWLRPIAAGLTLHLALDVPFQRYDRGVWERSDGRCERCGLAGVSLDVYFRRSPVGGGSWFRADNRVVLCAQCVRELLAPES
jgi:hypothetical protein